jgi:hypothetical protein
MRRVVLGEMGVDLCIAQIVDRDDFDGMFFSALVVGPEDVAPDSAIAVDRDSNGHRKFSLMSNDMDVKG